MGRKLFAESDGVVPLHSETIVFALHSVGFFPQILPFFKYESSYILTLTDPSIEIRLDNRVRVYGDKHAIILLAQLIAEYPSIWKSEGFV